MEALKPVKVHGQIMHKTSIFATTTLLLHFFQDQEVLAGVDVERAGQVAPTKSATLLEPTTNIAKLEGTPYCRPPPLPPRQDFLDRQFLSINVLLCTIKIIAFHSI